MKNVLNHSLAKAVYLFSIIFVMPSFSFSCKKDEPVLCSKVEDSLIYIRGEKRNGEQALNAVTGFVVAKEESKKDNKKYYALTVIHGLGNQKTTVFKGVSFKEKRIVIPNSGYLSKKELFVANKDNQFDIKDLDIRQVGNLDTAIVSFSTSTEIPSTCISLNKTDIQDETELQSEGFVPCHLLNNYDNEHYFMHKKDGRILSNNNLDKSIMQGNAKEKEFFTQMKTKEEEWKHTFDREGIDLRHQIPGKEGMSGSPIFNANQQVLAMHSKSFHNEPEISNCTLSPQSQHGYGISMEKILSENFPDDVRKHMNIQK
jgi:hypothetical protein